MLRMEAKNTKVTCKECTHVHGVFGGGIESVGVMASMLDCAFAADRRPFFPCDIHSVSLIRAAVKLALLHDTSCKCKFSHDTLLAIWHGMISPITIDFLVPHIKIS